MIPIKLLHFFASTGLPKSKSRFSSFNAKFHENPLGLPRSDAPPVIPRMQRGLPQKRSIPGVGKVIAVSSAKGGVGKSTIAGKLYFIHPVALQGRKVGILDTDIFGPSIPKLFNLSGEPSLDNRLIPLQNYGVESMSMGFLVGEEAPVVWRGLMVMKALQQLLHEVEWGALDLLILDLPPGTGDTQLTITQQILLDGAVIVSTPQDIALIDAVKGINMFKKVNVPLLGIIQNMSIFVCPKCNHETSIFGCDGARRTAEKHGIEHLGDIPLHQSICAQADLGKPTVISEPDGIYAQIFREIAKRICNKIGL
ncbi:Iron-sulfur protein IND1 [Neolecta irregularis DAH-3]|uniref:Iron-sulfur protein IND1 n=1 Tax=Neolecta irregularis (strain DAH-3) TaxID=1198029 RepID=A0A1U7LLI7_NEOID|nr:Iron-sulfur protein IND1 [Neolecta irregularis DAH-3]|eukprot:OLL23453.1 Iron-sulfur protein IND1 [Neolecta irregularis DAH-3]